mmetsp:Transcript_4875/g.9729  ORF Transcript_4875/g.9729 Transcript_4875/m.9729 type:complete len:133 (-) Transcript_4875:1767-2165(-)
MSWGEEVEMDILEVSNLRHFEKERGYRSYSFPSERHNIQMTQKVASLSSSQHHTDRCMRRLLLDQSWVISFHAFHMNMRMKAFLSSIQYRRQTASCHGSEQVSIMTATYVFWFEKTAYLLLREYCSWIFLKF